MPRPRRNLSNMEIDEISLVDKGANQHAMIAIAKRASEEDQMPELYNEDGSLVDEGALEEGDIVFDEEGNAYQFEVDDEEIEEPVAVGKSAFGSQQSYSGFANEIREELSKAFSDDERDEVLSKAFGRLEELEMAQQQAEEIAKSERDLRLTREYISKAAEYNLPIAPQDLGPVLYRMAETMSYDDCAVIAKCLESAGDMIFQEVGYTGGGDNVDIMSAVEQRAVEIGKSASPENVAQVFDESPQAYDEYLAAQRNQY